MADERIPPESLEAGHETKEANARLVVLSLAGLFVAGVLIHLLLAWFFNFLAVRIPAGPPVSPLAVEREPPAPRLQAKPQTDLERMRAAEEEILNTYGWVDREAGIVRLPVDRAIDKVVGRGLNQGRGTK